MSVVLDPTHGVNPSTACCFFCNEAKVLVLWGRLTQKQRTSFEEAGVPLGQDGGAPRNIMLDHEPCGRCKEYMKQGVILISVREPIPGDDPNNPYRTGRWVVIKEEAIRQIVQPKELADSIVEKRMAFVPDDAWEVLGLPSSK